MEAPQSQRQESPHERVKRQLFERANKELRTNIEASGLNKPGVDVDALAADILKDRWDLAREHYQDIIERIKFPSKEDQGAKEYEQHLESAQMAFASRISMLWAEIEHVFMTGSLIDPLPRGQALLSRETAKELLKLLYGEEERAYAQKVL